MSSKDLFIKFFSELPEVSTSAHGRVNLIGEHTDYNNGFVLPTLIPQKINVSIRRRNDKKIIGCSDDFGFKESVLDSPTDGSWIDFIKGAITLLNKESANFLGIDIAVTSDVPIASGLSSSAALEVSSLKALSSLANLDLDEIKIAKLGQKIEHEFIGTNCGIMDQLVSARAEFGEVLFIDCESLNSKSLKFFPNHTFLIFHSGNKRKLSISEYNSRKKETEIASDLLQVSSLRHTNINQIINIKDKIIRKRAKHIISENQRVLNAVKELEENNAINFGKLMYESHNSMAHDYEISSPELDGIVDAAKIAGATGARLTGAGFGGCVVILVPKSKIEIISKRILEKYPKSFFVTKI